MRPAGHGGGADSVTAVPRTPDAGLEAQIGQWRGYVQRHRAISPADVDELEGHLRDQVADLEHTGLSGDEAFLVAVKRMGSLDQVSREFAREHSERLWKQLVLTPELPEASDTRSRRELVVVLALAVAAAVAIKAPALAGYDLDDDASWYARNFALLVLPFLAGYFSWKRRLGWARSLRLLAPPFLFGALVANVYPHAEGGSTEVLVAIHLPILLWFVVGLAYVGGDWRSHPRRMDFIRFTGEWAVYYTLLALGGAVLVGLTLAGFEAIGLEISSFIEEGAPLRRGGRDPRGRLAGRGQAERRGEHRPGSHPRLHPADRADAAGVPGRLPRHRQCRRGGPGPADPGRRDSGPGARAAALRDLRSGSAGAARPVRPIAAAGAQRLAGRRAHAVAMLIRITEFGASPNKTAALGLNLILLANLAWSARLSVGFLRRRLPFSALERWQTTYLPVYAAWAAVVVLVFPPAFSFT